MVARDLYPVPGGAVSRRISQDKLRCVISKMGCLSSKEKYNVNKEERGLRTHRVPDNRFSDNSAYRGTLSRPASQQNFTVTLDRGMVRDKADHSMNNTNLVNGRLARNCSEKSSGLSSRNQFDRASQLRRSKKKRRKSDDNMLTPRKDQSMTDSSVGTPNTALEIVKQETRSLNVTSHSINSRAEYNSTYGNLI